MRLLYTFFVRIYYLLVLFASPFNHKAKKWITGRRNIFKKIAAQVPRGTSCIWMHCSSLGEFEQGRPVLEALKRDFPEYKILLTFFSPSGYELRKDCVLADFIFYLPLDTLANAKKFINHLQPKIAIFVKYEYWYNYLRVLALAKIPHVYISSIFRRNQYFFNWHGAWFRKQLRSVTHFFVQNEASKKLLNDYGFAQVSISGDTRFDRVFELSQKAEQFPLIKAFKAGQKLLIAGSTWPPDEEIIRPLFDKFPEMKFILAPHEIKQDSINRYTEKFKQRAIRYSQAEEKTIARYQILIIDNIGILSQLYQYATFAYIGGGFGTGIHNIQEAVTFGKPVIFGPNFHKFQEAVDLTEKKGAFCINHYEELHQVVIELAGNEDVCQKASKVCKTYVDEQKGATRIISDKIIEYLA